MFTAVDNHLSALGNTVRSEWLGIQVCKVFKDPYKKKKAQAGTQILQFLVLNILCITVTVPVLLGQLFAFTTLTVPQRQNRCFVITCLFGGRLPWQSWHWAESFYWSGAMSPRLSPQGLREKCAHRWQHLPYPTPIIPPPPRSQFCTETRAPP